ncbi:hypothetical protein [Brevundimonas sp. SORGH_AS_0993]|uniref:hypothetical protein n=1 Tax=Brevundimonas sp. SORGH_AS_0993 TaxID=3041794 RepID=UPI00277FCFC0|nr:hypothetical protein [Brevundimonas sp. SORGH_AS_0993]MDQ1154347.1 hypothetical protein [Brevundimonas sp. SORGH_AS_0993]
MKHGASRSAYLDWLAQAFSEAERFESLPDGDVVVGYATGYDAADIAPFVLSLRAVFDGPVALVVDDAPELRAFLSRNRITAVDAPVWRGWAPHPVMQRFVAFAGLLGDRPGAALACDVRDVIFQAPPFAPAPTGLEAFVEAEGPLADHAFNMKHLRALFGQAQADRMADKPCLCVGTLIGPRAEAARLSRLILSLAAAPRSEIGGAFGADQAGFNLAVHQGLIAATIQPNYGRVATLGLTPGDRLSFVDGRAVNPDGTASPIVHQHDRHPHLDAPVHARWGGGLEHRKRVRPKSESQKWAKLKASLRRRTPELR